MILWDVGRNKFRDNFIEISRVGKFGAVQD